MSTIQLMIEQLITTSLHNKSIQHSFLFSSDKFLSPIQCIELYEELVAHQLHLVLYQECKALFHRFSQLNPNQEIFYTEFIKAWSIEVKLSTLLMQSSLTSIQPILNSFKDKGLKVMVLKGYYFRHLYSQPGTRIMSDVDLYVDSDYLESAHNILIHAGYHLSEDDHSSLHHIYEHPRYTTIELHYAVVREDLLKRASAFNDYLWHNAAYYQINGDEMYLPTPENHAIFAMMHMYNHLLTGGFGFRQVYDLFRLITAFPNFDWSYFHKHINHYGLTNFTLLIFSILYDNFDFSPNSDTARKFSRETEKLASLLYQDIYSAGAFGKKSEERRITNALAEKEHLTGHLSHHDTFGLSNEIALIFPSLSIMKRNYSYLNKYPFLLIIAWGHRIFKNLFNPNVSFRRKVPHLDKIHQRLDIIHYIERG